MVADLDAVEDTNADGPVRKVRSAVTGFAVIEEDLVSVRWRDGLLNQTNLARSANQLSEQLTLWR